MQKRENEKEEKRKKKEEKWGFFAHVFYMRSSHFTNI